MAKGWESKAVEAQREEELEEKGPWKPPEQLEEESKLHGLERSKTRIERELEEATTETHRAALQNALQYLAKEIDDLRSKE
ncbi:MAG: hypothetical protein LC732_04525 [Acidobacteria bacterium]|nr:hypothetical protein [Acidobacteriota bacterium]